MARIERIIDQNYPEISQYDAGLDSQWKEHVETRRKAKEQRKASYEQAELKDNIKADEEVGSEQEDQRRRPRTTTYTQHAGRSKDNILIYSRAVRKSTILLDTSASSFTRQQICTLIEEFVNKQKEENSTVDDMLTRVSVSKEEEGNRDRKEKNAFEDVEDDITGIRVYKREKQALKRSFEKERDVRSYGRRNTVGQESLSTGTQKREEPKLKAPVSESPKAKAERKDSGDKSRPFVLADETVTEVNQNESTKQRKEEKIRIILSKERKKKKKERGIARRKKKENGAEEVRVRTLIGRKRLLLSGSPRYRELR